MKLSAILKTTAFAVATMFFLGCSDSDSDSDKGSGSGKGVIEFSILGENIEYQNLEFTGTLRSAKIDYAYMLVQNPTLIPSHSRGVRHVGETLEGAWAVDLMDPDGIMNPEPDSKCTPTVLGHLEVESGAYEEKPKITMPKPPASWDGIVAKSETAKTKLQEKNLTFMFGGSLVDDNGTTYKFEIREPLATETINIAEFPHDGNEDPGTKLIVPSDDTLTALFHPHIDHALEVFDENSVDLSTLEQENGVIVISDVMNTTATNATGKTVELYMDMVKHIVDEYHWDVNVIVVED